MQIAIYGKGGIGKSTLSAHLSAALALRGRRVLQIGCDPKHDSTRLLHHGRRVNTVLDYLLNTPADDQRLEDVLAVGFGNVGCVEAGGPRPGMGCAGRGILTSFDFLNRHNAFSSYDTIVYDVLGDVVCGGFAVPVRKAYADAVFLVTSGEAMAIYAANNILQGIRNLDASGRRMAGILYNSRGEGDDRALLERFARAVGLPICAAIPRSAAFARAERAASTLLELEPDGVEARAFTHLARQIDAGLTLYEARPLDEAAMERLLRGESPSAPSPSAPPLLAEAESPAAAPAPVIPQKRALSDPFSRVPLFGCAYRGAVDLAVHIKDAAVLGHAPKSCTWFAVNGLTGYSRRGLFERGVLYPSFIPQHFENSDITVQDAVFGGVEGVRQKALSLARQGIRAIIAVTSCIPGMSGDDLTPVRDELKALGCEMIIVRADGVQAGDYNQGMALCCQTLAREAVRPDVTPEGGCINIVHELTWSSATDENFARVKAMLDALGIQVNCRFLCATCMDDIHHFLRAPYSVLARDDAAGRSLRALFEETYGCRFIEGTLPRGFGETCRWVRTLGQLYHKEALADALIERSRAQYLDALIPLKTALRGRRAMVFLTRPGANWLPELLEDLELDVVSAMLPRESDDANAAWNRRFSAQWDADRDALRRAVDALRPDILLLGDASALSDAPEALSILPVPREIGVGFFAGVQCAEGWLKRLDNRLKGGWKRDRALFEKYHR